MRTAIQVTQHVKYILFNLYLTFVFDTLGGGGFPGSLWFTARLDMMVKTMRQQMKFNKDSEQTI